MGFSGRLPKFIQPITTKISSNNSASTSCLLDQSPPLDSTQFEIKKRIKVAKGTSGNVVELYPRFAEILSDHVCPEYKCLMESYAKAQAVVKDGKRPLNPMSIF